MDNIKTSSRKMRGGILASAIVLLFTLLTLGIGTAFGAEGGLVGLLKKAVGDVASPVMNAASGGMLRAEGGDDKLQVPIRIVWDDNNDEYGVRPDSVTLSLRACLDGSQWGGADIPSATITPTGDSWETTIEVDKTYVNSYNNQEYSVTGVEFRCYNPPMNYNADTYSVVWQEGEGTAEFGFTRKSQVADPSSATTMSVSIVWDDNNNEHGNRPNSLAMSMDNQGSGGSAAQLNFAPDGGGNWPAQSVTVPTQYFGGEDIQYGFSYVNYVSAYSYSYEFVNGGYVITLSEQTKDPQDLIINWADQNHAEARPSSVVVSITDSSDNIVVTKTANMSEATSTDGSEWVFDDFFDALPMYINGTGQTYKLSPTPPSSYQVERISGIGSGSYTVSFASTDYPPAEYFDVELHITWDDKNDINGVRPDSVDVYFKDNASPQNTTQTETITGSGNEWVYTVHDLPTRYTRYDNSYSRNMTYLLTYTPYFSFPSEYESSNPAWYWSINPSGYDRALYFTADDASDTVELDHEYHLNRYNATLNVIWNDDNDAQGARPESIDVALLQASPYSYGSGIPRRPADSATSSWSQIATKEIGESDATSTNAWSTPLVVDSDNRPVVGSTYGSGGKFITTPPSSGEGGTRLYFYRTTAPDVAGYTKSPVVEDTEGNFTVTYTKEGTPTVSAGGLSITKTVAGEGANQSQSFPFTITVAGAGNDTYDGVQFTNDVATVNLTHDQTVTITGLPADAAYSVSEGEVANYSASWANQSGTIVAGEVAAVTCTNTYTAPVPSTGGLSITKTVTGDGANQSQSFQFTITVAGAGNNTYDGVQFTNDVATVNLTHGQTTTITGLPANASYSVAEGTPENYTASWTNQSGTIVAGETAAVTCTNTYSAPAPLLQPETVDITLTRDDDDPTGDPITLTLVETLPEEIDPENVDTSDLNLVVTPPVPSEPRSYPPTADPVTNSFVYTFPIDDDETMTVPVIEGSDVTITNTSPGDDITQDPSSPTTQTGQMLVMQSITRGTPIPPITVSASPKAAPAHPQRNQGWIRVNTNPNVNTAVSYQAFKVFDAAVSYDSVSGNYNGTHVEWESDAVKAAVMNFLNNADSRTAYDNWLAAKYNKTTSELVNADRELAQNAAEYIALMIGNSAEDTTANTTPKTTLGDSFASKLATVLRNYGLVPVAVPANTNTTVDQGYYVVATDPSTIGNDEAGTAPIWVPVPEAGYTVQEKVSKPVFNKQVKDNTDVTDEFGKIADASTGQALDFRLTTTLPANVKAFASYPLTITDALPAGIDPLELTQANGYSVLLGEADITSQVTAAAAQDGTLTFSIANALALDGVDGGSVITINYRAALNEGAVKGSAGNPGEATLTYPADTMTEATADLTSSATVLTYQLRVDKVDEANRLKVDDAQFAVQTTVGGTTYWVKSDGSLTTTLAERGVWTTQDGHLTISGIDEGTYVVKEIQAPQHYEAIASDLEVIINATKDYSGGTLTALAASASGANGTLVDNPSATQDGFLGSDLATGMVRVRISDVKQIVLPLTGMPVKTLGIIVGVGIAVASVIALVIKRRREQGEEDIEE